MSSISLLGSSSVPSAMDSARTGIKRGMSGLDRDAQVIADADSGPVDANSTTHALIDSHQEKSLVEISARVLATEDQTLGTLLDIKA